MLSLEQLADLLERKPSTVLSWEHDGIIDRPTPLGTPRQYNWRQVLDILARRAEPEDLIRWCHNRSFEIRRILPCVCLKLQC